jgi:hypothetical protein|tara:strand:+ start:4651 stop:4839 length:189 start_codon:yes stop_codon:yes gene_type:complete
MIPDRSTWKLRWHKWIHIVFGEHNLSYGAGKDGTAITALALWRPGWWKVISVYIDLKVWSVG